MTTQAQKDGLLAVLTKLDVAFAGLIADEVVVPPTAPVIEHQTVNLARVVLFYDYDEGGRYQRWQDLRVLRGVEQIKFYAYDIAAGGVSRILVAFSYDLKIDGVVKATQVVPAGSTSAIFSVDVTSIPEGWHKFELVVHAIESTIPAWMYVLHNAVAGPQTMMPVQTGTYDLAHNELPYSEAIVPAVYAPTPRPLADRVCTPFSTADDYTTLYRDNLVPNISGDVHRPNVSKEGIVSSFGLQRYFFQDLTRKYPPFDLLDGARGVGTIMMPTDMHVGHSGGVYVCDPWRIMRVKTDGTIKTLAGYRHQGMGAYYYEGQHGIRPANLELVGDWSSIPVERQGFREIWGQAWDMDSAKTDPNAPKINGLAPHFIGPRCFIADSQNNRIILLTFSNTDASLPCKVTEFITGLDDPWDVKWDANVIYISERKANRIIAHDATTGAFLRVVVASTKPGLAVINDSRLAVRIAPLATIRAEPCYLPEGLCTLHDGWLSFGSFAQAQIKRVNLTTGEIQVMVPDVDSADGNAIFGKIAQSDNSVGPLGTYFSWTWSNANFGFPRAWKPDGKEWPLVSYMPLLRGPGGNWSPLGYGTAGAVGQGRLYTGSSEEGLTRLSKTLPTDAQPDHAKYEAGQKDYFNRGLHIVYGEAGFDCPLGITPQIDYYLNWVRA